MSLTPALLMRLVPGFLLFTVVYTFAVRILEPRLSIGQAVIISAAGSSATIAVMVVYYLAKAPFGLDKSFDTYVALVAWFILGITITQLAKRYGIQKTGWFRLGGKANLWILFIGWIVIAVVVAVKYFTGNM